MKTVEEIQSGVSKIDDVIASIEEDVNLKKQRIIAYAEKGDLERVQATCRKIEEYEAERAEFEAKKKMLLWVLD